MPFSVAQSTSQPTTRPTTKPAAASALAAIKLNPTTVVGKPGYFRVGQDLQRRWWLVTPDDKPIFYRGVTSVNTPGTPGGRRAKPGPYGDTCARIYGDDITAFTDAQIRRLRQWGFNGLGAWCDSAFFEHKVDGEVMPYTEILEFGYIGNVIKGPGIWLPDVLDPAWEKAADAWADMICTPLKDKTGLIGYFTDNELSWAQPRAEDIAQQANPNAKVASRPTLLQHCLSLPDDAGAFKAAWEYLLKRYGTIPAVGRAWGITLRDRGGIRALNPDMTHVVVGDGTKRMLVEGAGGPPPKWTVLETPAYYTDEANYSQLFARKYFEQTSKLIRKYDPNHLILGCRFGAPPGAVVLAAMDKKWVDLVSANNYQMDFVGRMDIYYRGTGGLPVLNTEFAYHTSTFLLTGGRSAERMAANGARALLGLARHPGVVGYTWYRLVQDEPTPEEARRYPLSCGLVNTQDQPVKIHIDTLTAVNAQLDAVAATRPAVYVPKTK